jgi:bifunctional DNA-binding transcriptional regulator/antitoxin component of YhaV-PrlF toxin-antitoxin module
MLEVISVSKIGTNRIYIKKEIIDYLNIDNGDEILYILDRNGTVNIRKFKKYVNLGVGEKYIYSAGITFLKTEVVAHISSEVIGYINADIGDKILWILDSKGNIIIRNSVILNGCSLNIFKKEISALIINLSMIYQKMVTTVPKEIIDILDIYRGDKIILSLDQYDNIIFSKKMRKNVIQEATVSDKYSIYLGNIPINILDRPNKILWLVDEEGNVVIKNNLLHDNCA